MCLFVVNECVTLQPGKIRSTTPLYGGCVPQKQTLCDLCRENPGWEQTRFMSDYRGHVAAGAAFYGVAAFLVVVLPIVVGYQGLALFQHWWEIPAQLVVAVMAALWPDVDVTSQGRKLFYRLFLVLDLYLIFTGTWIAAALLGLLAILPGLGRHRGWTHTLWAALLIPATIMIVPMFLAADGSFRSEPSFERTGVLLPYYLAAVVGYLSHLAADNLLGDGIGRLMTVLLWPVRVIWKSVGKVARD